MRRVRSQFLQSIFQPRFSAVAAAMVVVAALGAAAAPASAVAPQVTEQVPLWVEQSKATLRAMVNPSGKSTSYHFEWGTDGSYGNRVPADHELFVGSGSEPVAVTAILSSLDKETAYRFRVVASNADGTTVGANQPFSTLNDDGLAWGRRYELVSPLDKGATGQAGQEVVFGGLDLQTQTSLDGKATAYTMTYGTDQSTAGGEVAYRSDRSLDGWLPTQVAPTLAGTGTPVQGTSGSSPGRFNAWLSSDLECGFAISAVPLTDDPVAQAVIDAGSYNLYRRSQDGSYDLVSNLAPTPMWTSLLDPVSIYAPIQASEDCERVIFEAPTKYPGVPFTAGGNGAQSGLYEWRDGVLGNPAALSGLSGPEYPSAARPGASGLNLRASWNALSRDGTRFYFTSTGAGTSTPLGRDAIFVSEDGEPTKEVSLSQTATPSSGNARYQMATPDGDYVYFLARYDLAPNASSSGATTCTLATGNNLGIGCDLYRYSVESGTLTDLSASSNPDDTAGASVAGVLDASEDGSRVYFAAKGQLVAGKGQTYAQNIAAATRGYNVYLSDAGSLSYVTTVLQADVTGGGAVQVGLLVSTPTTGQAPLWASRTTPDGGHLVFQSTSAITGPSGVVEAYRFSAASGKVECVSCRRDGLASLGFLSFGDPRSPLVPVASGTGGDYSHPTRTISDDGRTIFFRKRDPLAPGAISGQPNLLEWHDGQVSLLVAEIPEAPNLGVKFQGAGADGRTVFMRSKRPLVSWDEDGRNDIYAARVGGGFAPPLVVPSNECDPLGEVDCVGPAADTLETPGLRTSGPGDDNQSAGARMRVTLGRISSAQRARASRTGVVRVRVSSTRAGSVRVIAKARTGRAVRRVGAVTRRFVKPGTATVALRLDAGARRQLRRNGSLRVTVQASPAEGRATTVGLVLRRAGR